MKKLNYAFICQHLVQFDAVIFEPNEDVLRSKVIPCITGKVPRTNLPNWVVLAVRTPIPNPTTKIHESQAKE